MVVLWNWKAALLSAWWRGLIFLVANLPAGYTAALRAMATELVFRTIASGVLGAATEHSARRARSRPAIVSAIVIISAAGHGAEYLIHRAAGTPLVGRAVAASIAFTLLSTSFNLFAMSRGVLTVGGGRSRLRDDLRRLPDVCLDFLRMRWRSKPCI